MYKICVVGTGYVGLVTGACLADFGNAVTCVDSDVRKIGSLKEGCIPFYEPGLEEVVKRNFEEGRLSFSTDLSAAVKKNRVIFITVGTPSNSKGEADLSQVFQVAADVARSMTAYRLIVQKSTVPVGTGRRLRQIIERNLRSKKIAFDVASNPEFLREGSAVENFMRPDRVVIGASSARAMKIMSDIYSPLYLIETPMIKTGVESAEMIKYASNAFLATKISFINEIANVCERVGADVQVVAKAMGLDRRIGPKFLHAGPGYGGSCFPKDTNALAAFSEEAGYNFRIVHAAIKVNKEQRRIMLEKILGALGGTRGRTAAILGLAFKPNTDDTRESPALYIARNLMAKGIVVRAFDPVAKPRLRGLKLCRDAYETAEGADVLVIVTEWNEFRRLDLKRLRKLLRKPVIVDCRNIYDPELVTRLGFRYLGVGRGHR